jgi:hypothetical protein
MYSSALNLLTLAGLMWHLWYLACRCVIWFLKFFLQLPQSFLLYSRYMYGRECEGFRI